MVRPGVRMVRDNREGWLAGGRMPERNQPATSMNLTNRDKMERDARSLLKAGWSVEKIASHFARHPDDYGTGLNSDALTPYLLAVLGDLERAARELNAKLREQQFEAVRHLKEWMCDYARRSDNQAVRKLVSEHFRITL